MSEKQVAMLDKLRRVSSEREPYLAKTPSENGTVISLLRRGLLEQAMVEFVCPNGSRVLRRGVWVKEDA